MPPTKKRTPVKTTSKDRKRSLRDEVQSALTWLKRHSTKATRDGMARYGIPSDNAFGVTMANLKVLAKQLGQDHELAAALWETGWYEARMLTSFVDEPALVTPAQMDRWCRDFDNWGICDTVCFKLFDQAPHAWSRVPKWAKQRGEFQKRAGFALLASLAGHDKSATDAQFIDGLRLIEEGAADDRDLVRKGVSWALRRIGTRNKKLRDASLAVARRLAASDDPSARWVGKDAVRDLTRAR